MQILVNTDNAIEGHEQLIDRIVAISADLKAVVHLSSINTQTA